MGSALVVISSLLLSSSSATDSVGQHGPTDPLWRKAVDLARGSEDWRPTRSVARTEELGKDGTVKSVEEVTLDYPSTPDDSPELVRFLRNGVDVTEKERARFLRRQVGRHKEGKRISASISGSPFDAKLQATTFARRTGETRSVDGHECQVFEYERPSPGGGRIKGSASLAAETGVPLSLVESPDPLPRFVDRLRVTMTFDGDRAGEWHPSRVIVEGAGGFLFLKKSVRSTIRFVDSGP